MRTLHKTLLLRWGLLRSRTADAGDAILDSIIRTLVPMVVGLVVSGLVAIGWHPSDVDQANLVGQVSALLTVVITAVYYALVRLLETKVSPKFGWLLGLAKTPVYSGSGVTPEDEQDDDSEPVPDIEYEGNTDPFDAGGDE